MTINYKGSVAAKGFQDPSLKKNQPDWRKEVDYYAVCACIHQLLVFQELQVLRESSTLAARRGFDARKYHSLLKEADNTSYDYLVPRLTIKR